MVFDDMYHRRDEIVALAEDADFAALAGEFDNLNLNPNHLPANWFLMTQEQRRDAMLKYLAQKQKTLFEVNRGNMDLCIDVL